MPKIIEEVKDGAKIMPKALIYALVISTVLYILVSLSAVSTMPWDKLKEAPLSSVVGTVWGSNGILLMSVIALFATFNTVLAILVGFSRLLYGMAKEHGLPSILSKIHPTRRTPYYSIFTIMCLSIFFLLLGDISTVASVTDLGIFIVFFVTNVSLIALRYKDHKSMARPSHSFRAPLNIGWFPLTALFGMISVTSLILHFETMIYVYEVGIIVIGFVLYGLLKMKY
jgi:APA family basic amino acid/polyamine antiporter